MIHREIARRDKVENLGSALSCIKQGFFCMSIRPVLKASLRTFEFPAVLQNRFQVGNKSVPVLTVTCPLFGNVHGCQIQHFQQTVIGRKYHFGFYIHTHNIFMFVHINSQGNIETKRGVTDNSSSRIFLRPENHPMLHFIAIIHRICYI